MGFMDTIWNFLGLMGTLDESGEGYEPSPVSKMLAVDSKTNYEVVDFGKKYSGAKKVLIVCTEMRYMTMENGKKFSTGNHPVETVHPLMHLVNAGFDFDICTPTGKPACIEMWAMPQKDEAFLKFFDEKVKSKVESPLSLASIAGKNIKDTYVCMFIPGGHGAMLGLPEDPNLGKMIEYFKGHDDRILMSICHGPAALLASKAEPHPYSGYKLSCFPDSIDKMTPSIGYMPGKMPWYFGEKLTASGMEISNSSADDTVVMDRGLMTGASPKASQKLGVAVAEKLLELYA